MQNLKSSVKWRFMYKSVIVAVLFIVGNVFVVGLLTRKIIDIVVCTVYTSVGYLLLLWFVNKVVSNRVIKPLHMLIDKTEAMGRGEFKAVTPVFKSNDELAVLERTIVGYYNHIQTVEWARVREVNAHIQTIEAARQGVMQMLDSLPFCCQVLNLQGLVLDCNNSCVEFFGFKSKEDYISRFNVLTFSPAYQTDGACSVDKWRQLITHVLLVGSCEFEWTYVIDGERVPVGVTLVRVFRGSEVVIVSSSVDLRRMKRLEEEAHNGKFDFLTGIYNRRAFDIEIAALMEKLKNVQGMLGLLYMDIDFFKKYNDTYGHNQGDTCLKSVANVLKAIGEELGILVARFGGEEFIVALEVRTESDALYVADKLCTQVRSLNIPHEASEVAPHVTLSVGVTVGRVTQDSSIRAFIERADAALYESKQGGRNRYTYKATD